MAHEAIARSSCSAFRPCTGIRGSSFRILSACFMGHTDHPGTGAFVGNVTILVGYVRSPSLGFVRSQRFRPPARIPSLCNGGKRTPVNP
jgi:hypothetical protein